MLETHYAIKTGKLYDFSIQQLVSCCLNEKHCGGTGGCHGFTAGGAFNCAIETGITEEWMYGYQSYFGDVPQCAFDPARTKPIAKPTGVSVVKSNDAAAMMDALVTAGPISVSVDASHFRDYHSGVYDGCGTGNITMNHAVIIVGAGFDADA